MGVIRDVLGPLVATHPEAPYLLSLIRALDDGSLDARIDVISALLRPGGRPKAPVEGFL